MKQLLGLLFCVVLSILLSLFTDMKVEKDVSNTLFTVVGIMFSIGMSIGTTFNTSVVTNKNIRNNIRDEINRIRDLFIICFVVVTGIYVLNILFENWTFRISDKQVFCLGIFQMIAQLYSIAYFIVNFKSLQNLNNQIGDLINDKNV